MSPPIKINYNIKKTNEDKINLSGLFSAVNSNSDIDRMYISTRKTNRDKNNMITNNLNNIIGYHRANNQKVVKSVRIS